jgi:hypothetical protein
MNMPSRTIQSLWRNYIATPPNKTPLSEIIAHNGAACGISRLIVAHHRPPNLGNYYPIGSSNQTPALLSHPICDLRPRGTVVVVVVVVVAVVVVFLESR